MPVVRIMVIVRLLMHSLSEPGTPATGGTRPGELFFNRTTMVFTKRLREGIRRGRIRCTVRIWTSPHVKVGGRYRMDDGCVVVESITPTTVEDLTDDLARESGFSGLADMLGVARHGKGRNVYLIRFHYVPPGGWDQSPATAVAATKPLNGVRGRTGLARSDAANQRGNRVEVDRPSRRSTWAKTRLTKPRS